MRLLIEIFVIGALIYIGWEKPFRDWLPNSQPAVTATPNARAASHPQPRSTSSATAASQPSGAWMNDPNRRTALDTPHPLAGRPQPTASAAGSWMFDPNHRSPLDPPKKGGSPH
jgi:hypothetical protein